MTVIDRAHRLVLILLATAIPVIFLVDLIVEVIRDDITFSPGWQLYLALEILAIFQIRTRRWEADWIIVGGGIGTAFMGFQSHFGNPTVIDLTAAVGIIPMAGLVAVAISRRAPLITGGVLGIAALSLSSIALETEGLKPDDLITKAAAIALLFGLASWLLHQLRSGYERQLAERDRFVAAVSHELRSPLTALAGFTEAMSEQIVAPGSQEAAEIVELMAVQAREAVDIVEDLLVAARSDAGQVATDTIVVDLAEQVRSVADVLRPDQGEGEKTLTLEIGHVAVLADPLRVRQIVRNLITNSLRHGGDAVVVRTAVRDGSGVVEVADNGTAFDTTEIDTMFAAYGRAKNTDLKTGSIGLGLTVSRQLAGLMGGNLEATRQDGSTVFRLTLPMAPQNATTGR